MSMINDALRRAQTGTTPPPTPAQPASRGPSELAPIRMPSEALPPVIGANPAVPSIKLLDPVEERKSPLPMIFGIGFLLLVIGAAGAYWWAKAHGGFGKANVQARTASKETAELSGNVSATFQNPVAHAAEVFTAARNRGQEPEPVKAGTVAPEKSAAPVAAAPAPAPVPSSTARSSIVMGRPTPAATATAPTPAPVTPAAATAASQVTFPPLRLQSIYYRSNNPSVMINGRTLYVNDEVQGVTIAAIQPASVTLVLSGRTNVLTLR
jgi:cytoskeletal protein RodZ